jgi:excisionase family DNA binding protein
VKEQKRLAHNMTTGAYALGVSRPTLSRMLEEGLIKHRRYGKRVLIPVDAIHDFLNGEQTGGVVNK